VPTQKSEIWHHHSVHIPRFSPNRPQGRGSRRPARLPGRRLTWRGIGQAAVGAAVLAAAGTQLAGCAPRGAPHATKLNPASVVIADSSLTAVAVVSPDSAWAVGDTTGYTGIIARWNGKVWQRVTAPAGVLGLTSVSASSPADAWAVGYDSAGAELALYWDGTAWRRVRVPMAAGDLNGVTDISPTDTWAVGETGSGDAEALHWNGKAWRQVPLPAGTQGGSLFGVTALSAGNAWAVGRTGGDTSLILHWNGRAWQQVPCAGSGCTGNSYLASVAAVSPSDIWSVGGKGSGQGTLIAHWNGAAWQQVSSPAPKGGGALNGVSAGSASDVWAVGGTTARNALIEHWDGKSWKLVPSGTQQAASEEALPVGSPLYQVAVSVPATAHDSAPASGAGDSARAAGTVTGAVWAVGAAQADTDPVILKWDGRSWEK
jgi:hypothetical protein